MRVVTVRCASLLLAIALLALLMLAPAGTYAESSTVRIGVLAHRGFDETIKIWAPTAKYLTEKNPQYSFVIVPLDFQQIGPAVKQGAVDFVLANTSIYVELEAAYGVTRISTLKNKSGKGAFTVFGGVIFCRNDRQDIKNLEDLSGKSFMAVEETSFGGWRVAWLELKKKGINPYKEFESLRFEGTHDKVVYAVRDGKIDAGTVRTDILEHMADEGLIDLSSFRIINERHVEGFPYVLSTPLYPEWPFAKVGHTSDDLAQKVAIALLSMPEDSQAAKSAKIAGWTTPLDYQPVHEAMKELRVGPYVDFGKITLTEVLKAYWYLFVLSIAGLTFMGLVTSYVLKLNRKLKQSNKFTKTVLDSMNDAISIIDVNDFTIVDANSVFLKEFGFSEEETIGKKCHEITHHSSEACQSADDICPLLDLEKNNGHSMVEHVHYAKNGKKAYVEVSTSPIKDNNGNIIQVVHVSRNVTERKKNEEALQQSNEELKFLNKELEKAFSELKAVQSQLLQREKMASIGQLAAGVAHEINNPIGFIMSNLGTLQKYAGKVFEFIRIVEGLAQKNPDRLVAGIEESKKALKIDYIISDIESLVAESLDGTERVKDIVQNLKVFARLDEAEFSMADINAGLESTITIVWNELQYKAELKKEYGDIPLTKCNPGQLNQAFMNILVNAAHAIEKQGMITVKTWSGKEHIYVSIADTGCGIPQDKINRIFEPFFTTKDVGAGTGLGLSIAYDIIKKHNGEIMVESEAGKGTTFTLKLPIVVT
ncbi:MAG: PhnD/SsuA/transferrin family substrate-binding protein [Deltaproteobacteria bacterium]|nr:PhnD/SsuA/transferrin family substrate-binding protein [Deltaproteobacteria bacterium]